jgi:hypothetical protein
LPGVQSAGAVHLLPLGSGDYAAPLTIEGRPLLDGQAQRIIDWRTVTPGYFETLRMPLNRGMPFTDAEHAAGERVVVASMAVSSISVGHEMVLQRVE